ncbi:MAG TPA: OmpA family protein [Bacteroidia bacterium]|nr:OmpA family protein [Bacteroidia bacterium]HNT81016.1 OmpA family protein [Bacteroidia bacterium]
MKKSFFILFLFLLNTCISCRAQRAGQYTSSSAKAIRHYELATRMYDQMKTKDEAILTIEEVNKAILIDPNFIEAYLLKGDVSYDAKQYTMAAEAYTNAIGINENFFPATYYNLAKSEFMAMDYSSSLNHVKIFLSLPRMSSSPLRPKAERLLRNCEYAAIAYKNPVPFNPINMGSNVNSEYPEYLPALTADQSTLIYTRKLKKPSIHGNIRDEEDFYISYKTDTLWSISKPIGAPLNTNGNEGAHSISPDGKHLYFTGCDRQDGIGRCDLYISSRVGDRWSEPQNLGPSINGVFWDSQPSISFDGNTVYFLSNRKGGLGGIDIWQSTKNEKGNFEEAINVGAPINTAYNELSPFIHNDNQTIYFASDGHTGFGGIDIFLSRKDSSGNWGTPFNIGFPINTSGDENSFFVSNDGTTAYFASDRMKGFGDLDLYYFTLYEQARPTLTSYVRAVVRDRNSNRTLEADYEVVDVSSGKLIVKGTTDIVNGDMMVSLPSGKNYALSISKNGYLFHSENFECRNSTDMKNAYRIDVLLSPLQIGSKVVLRNIFFETNSYKLSNESTLELNKLLVFLTENKSIRVRINGHTDSVGDDHSNLTLSQQRASAVSDYLISNGISKDRISTKGFGESQPISDNETTDGRALNRRTEFEIIGL